MRTTLATCLLSFAALPVHAAISWNLNFTDVSLARGVGFDDPIFGSERRNTVTSVTNYISSQFQGSGKIDFTFNSSETDGSGPLASAGTFLFDQPDRFANGLVFDHATSGIDPAPSSHDGSATFDFGYNWNNSLNLTSNTQYDLFTIALHELTHAMGFISLIGSDGTSDINSSNPGVYGIFDSFIQRGNSTPIMSNLNGASFIGTPADLRSNNLFFSGPNATAANNGQPVKIYAPSGFLQGDSLSHLDPSVDSIMTTGIFRGESKRTYTEIDLGILQDIGWQLIPEHSVMAFVGAAGMLLLLRKR